MKTGKVKFFNDVKGFGFIIPDGETKEVFMHATGLVSKDYKPRQDDKVSFEEKEGQKGINAINVTPLN
jgi:CspA family cold shock protein